MTRENKHVIELVDDYLHEVLDRGQAEYVGEHCEVCPICKVALDEARRRFEAMQAVPTSEASEELIRATLAKVNDWEQTGGRRRRWIIRGGLLATAASVLLVASLHIYYATLSPSSCELRVYGQRQALAGTTGAIRVQLQDRSRNQGIKGVPVDVEMRPNNGRGYVLLASFTTDAQGTGNPRLTWPDWGDSKYELRVTARTGWQPDVVTRTIELKRSWKLMLSSDKPVYQPGQTIQLRALALRRPDLKPVSGHESTFAIADPKGNVIFKQREVASEFGIVSANCPLATEIIEGPYTVTCKIGDTESKLTVDVKKYVLPKFKIEAELDQPYYQPGEMMHGSVTAGYFFGKPVADGKIAVEIRTTDVGPVHQQMLTAQTDREGKAEFRWRLPKQLVGRPQDNGDAKVDLLIMVTDSAGQKQVKAISRRVTTHPLRVEIIPEGGNLVRDIENTVYVVTTYADGRPAQARLSVSGLDREVKTNGLGAGSFALTPTTDSMKLVVRATDDAGRTGRLETTLACGTGSGDFLIRTDQSVYRGGQTVHLVAMAAGNEPVFVDFVKDGQTLLTQMVSLSKGRGDVQFDLPAEMSGTIELQAYRFGDAGLAQRKTRVLYVRDARQIRLDAKVERPEYRPAEQAKLAITLTDDQGKPVAGAVSLAAVDEAVFSVLEQPPGMERAFFSLEQDLLKPVYAIYSWSPDLATSRTDDDRRLLEQAIFSRTARGERLDNPTLQKMLDEGRISKQILDVLRDQDMDEFLSRGRLSNELTALVQSSRDMGSFTTNSFSKQRHIERIRTAGMARVQTAWWILVAVVVIGGIIILFERRATAILITLAACGLLISILTPSLNRARESAPRSRLAAEVAAVDHALSAMTAENTPLVTVGTVASATGTGRVVPTLVAAPAKEHGPAEAAPPVRVREWFPETLLWRPELITDENGRATIDVELADSITTWRLTASAVSADGRLGGMQSAIRVFQPFFVDLNLPVALTRGDEVAVPVAVYNYLDRDQTVELTLDAAPWFESLDEAGKQIVLKPGEVRSTSYRLRAIKVGHNQLQVTARGTGVADAIKRDIEVVPDGRRVDTVFSGTLSQPADISLDVPADAIEGSVKAIVKIYPSSFSQLVEGLDAIFQQPYGCFEQTSSTTYPNVLALDYLRRTGKSAPQIEAKARQYIHLGYQRLLGFEISGGGFDWFGRPPANRTLTAYGLMEFQDMAKVHDVDPALIERTRKWLLSQRRPDGSWAPESHGMHEDPTAGGASDKLATLSTTAYIAWSVFAENRAKPEADATLAYLHSARSAAFGEPYVLALLCNALAAMEPAGSTELSECLSELEAMKQASLDGRKVWWPSIGESRTLFHGYGRSRDVETTAMAALAFLKTGRSPETVRGALAWLVEQKDGRGTWHSTQATVLALKALITGTGTPLGSDKAREIELVLNEAGTQRVAIAAEDADLMKQSDLSDQLKAGANRLTITERSGTAAGYQVVFRYHVPSIEPKDAKQPLTINIAYDRSELAVGDSVTATATVTNRMKTDAPMVILDLPVPPGFAIDADDLQGMVKGGQIAKYQLNARSAVVYLRGLSPGKPLTLRYHLQATMPVRVTAPAARAYEYYNSDNEAYGKPVELKVRPRA